MELGMNHAGEISTLVAIAEPDVRVWTNVGDAHLGFFASPDAIADAKAEILERADRATRARLQRRRPARDGARARLRRAGRSRSATADGATVRATDVEDRGLDGMRARVVDAGRRARARRRRCSAAATCRTCWRRPRSRSSSACRSTTSPPRRPRLRPADRRGAVRRLRDGVTLDRRLVQLEPGGAATGARGHRARDARATRKVAVLGEMLELGDHSTGAARGVRPRGRRGAASALLFASAARRRARSPTRRSTPGMPAAAVTCFETSDAAAPIVARAVRAGDLVLVKGSRGTAPTSWRIGIAAEFA